MPTTSPKTALSCFHCGQVCKNDSLKIEEKSFCCLGCKTVYQILNKSNLCTYYDLNNSPGINQKDEAWQGKFSFLDNEDIAKQLINFSDTDQAQATFYLPQMHCSSCLWLLENLHKIDSRIQNSRVNFTQKEVTILYNQKISLRKVAELLTSVGYEPHISLSHLNSKVKKGVDKKRTYRLGIAAFCFSNIMLLSFPEYFSLEGLVDKLRLYNIFRYLNLLLSLPVFFYCAGEFYNTAWKGLKHRFLNIDAPIVLAIFITFGRSVYEIITDTGAGYLDSMTGIVFFMLLGRILQDSTRRSLSFDRDYTSYFPIAVNKVKDGIEVPTALPDLKSGDTVIIHHNEIIPADGILIRGQAAIDYSFVTGESVPTEKQISEIIYAGGRQVGGNIELLLVKEVSQSYLTSLWNKSSFDKETDDTDSFIHKLSKYFTVILFTIALSAGIYWLIFDAAKVWPSVTAVLIVACPCALLLSSTFTNGHILRWFDKASFYLRSASVLEKISKISHIVFDKTGTLTKNDQFKITYLGSTLNDEQKILIASTAIQNNHPLSQAVASFLNVNHLQVESFKEIAGKGCEAWINDHHIIIGKPEFVFKSKGLSGSKGGSEVAFKIDNSLSGTFILQNYFREHLDDLLKRLIPKYKISVISGDNDASKEVLENYTHQKATLKFFQSPEDKLNYIKQLQSANDNVMMIGDGLNDAGALNQSNVGISVTDNINNFSPACDGIMEAYRLNHLDKFIALAKASKKIIIASFVISVLYNIIGLSIAVQGQLSPLIAAILMPSSSISIILFTWAAAEIKSSILLKKCKR